MRGKQFIRAIGLAVAGFVAAAGGAHAQLLLQAVEKEGTMDKMAERAIAAVFAGRGPHVTARAFLWASLGGRFVLEPPQDALKLGYLFATAEALLRDARYPAKPRPAKPISIIAQVGGSGTAPAAVENEPNVCVS
jgi:hypothetical protein